MSRIISEKLRKLQSQTKASSHGSFMNILIPSTEMASFDPVIRFDEFFLEVPDQFPTRHYKGFEGMIYLVSGQLKHTDDLGNEHILRTGDVQKFEAGKGIHVTEKAAERGINQGIYLWLNLPAAKKDKIADFHSSASKDLPYTENDQVYIKTVAGENSPFSLSSGSILKDILLNSRSIFDMPVKKEHSGIVYVLSGINGPINVEDTVVNPGEAIFFNGKETLNISTKQRASRFLVFTAAPLGQPINMEDFEPIF